MPAPTPAIASTFARLLAVVSVALLATGCSDPAGVADPPADARFSLRLSGVLETTLQGTAEIADEVGEPWALTLVSQGGGGRLRIWSRGAHAGPGPGDHALVDSVSADGGAAPGNYLLARVELPPNSFPDQAAFDFLVGTLTIDSVSDAGAWGTVHLATSVLHQPTRVLVVEGEFGG